MKIRISLRSSARFFSATLLIGMFVLSAFAQQGTSIVRGTVKDPQGNLVAGATVKLVSAATGAVRTVQSNGDGVFSFETVQPGDYRVEVEAQGFKKGVVTAVHALVASPTSVDVQLEVGNITGRQHHGVSDCFSRFG
jgi:hypothetical protein